MANKELLPWPPTPLAPRFRRPPPCRWVETVGAPSITALPFNQRSKGSWLWATSWRASFRCGRPPLGCCASVPSLSSTRFHLRSCPPSPHAEELDRRTCPQAAPPEDCFAHFRMVLRRLAAAIAFLPSQQLHGHRDGCCQQVDKMVPLHGDMQQRHAANI
jgi:hypothetical protein